MRLKLKYLDRDTNTNALNILTPHAVIASPKGVAIPFFMRLLRLPAKRGTPRNDELLIASVLILEDPLGLEREVAHDNDI